MDPITRAMFMGTAGYQGLVLPNIGDSFEGGFYAGLISHTADGVATHALIVAPEASGYNNKATKQFKTSNTGSTSMTSLFDGATNTANNANTSHPAANYCAGLSIGGYSDWYLPALYEMEIAYYHLKPSTASNNTTSSGGNNYAVPQRPGTYTSGTPSRTSVTAFRDDIGTEFFLTEDHWTSTQYSGSSGQAWLFAFNNGEQRTENKANAFYVRAFRKVAL
jgi:hypothetical protein